MFIILNLLFLIIFYGYGFANEPVTLDKIVVNPSEGVSTESLKKNYSTRIVSASELAQKNLGSVAEVLNYVAGVDVRTRGGSGIQSDVSLRGSTFEEVSVLIDGIKVMDPQTGHYNFDIPLTSFDIERIEVIKEGASSLYGAGAFAGSVNIVTKKPAKRLFQAQTLFGEHALSGQSMSLSMPQDIFSSRISFDHAISKAARPNTDFEYSSASVFLDKQFSAPTLGVGRVDAMCGYQKKDYGADSFYSNLFPEEEEHTQTFFLKAGVHTGVDFGKLDNSIFLRRHRDKFILARNTPSLVNYHTTYVYGMNSECSIPLEYGTFMLSAEAGSDEINSTNLGKHSRFHQAGAVGFVPELGQRFSLDSRVRVDTYQHWDAQESYNLGMGYYLIDEKLKLRGSLSHSFRIPSFTELFYSDAANKGNSELNVQKSDTLSAGIDWKDEASELGVGAFLRTGRDLIDWTRGATTERWSATNLGRVDFSGIEFSSKVNPHLGIRGVRLDSVIFSYTYTHADKKASGFYSKYALDILEHQYIFEAYSVVCGLHLDWQLSYNQRYYGETYFAGTVYAGKKIAHKDFVVEPFVKVENFTNAKYSEVGAVPQPGRWIKTGLKFQW